MARKCSEGLSQKYNRRRMNAVSLIIYSSLLVCPLRIKQYIVIKPFVASTIVRIQVGDVWHLLMQMLLYVRNNHSTKS